jgi:glycerol-3-phosphate acyltransferase PlsY
MIPTIGLMLAAYLLGSVNFAILLLRLLGHADPRTVFSGNAGTTNVYRQAGRFWAAVVLLLDVGRAIALAILADRFLPPPAAPWVALALVLGNRYPLFHGFRGGKGVAALLGFTLFPAPVAAAAACAVWVAIHRATRLPFIASFGMIAILAVGLALRYGDHPAAIAGIALTALLVAAHHRINWRQWRRERTGCPSGANVHTAPLPERKVKT